MRSCRGWPRARLHRIQGRHSRCGGVRRVPRARAVRGMISLLLPPRVVSREGDESADLPVSAHEESAVAGAVNKRVQEFRGGRTCAHRALYELGEFGPILSGPRGEPVWPPGVVGSITHCVGYRAAAVSRPAVVRAVGTDAEPHAPVPSELHDLVASVEEQDALAQLSRDHPDIHWHRVLFSAKESIYKAWFPITARWLGFDDVSVRIDARAGRFAVSIDPRMMSPSAASKANGV